MIFFISGLPVPNVIWTINNSKEEFDFLKESHCPNMPSTIMVSTNKSVTPPSLVVARLESPCLPRKLSGTLLGCSATNNNISNPVKSEMKLDMLGKYHSIQKNGRKSNNNKLELSWGSVQAETVRLQKQVLLGGY